MLNKEYAIVIFQSLMLVVIVLMSPPRCSPSQTRYNGYWWLRLTSEEQVGYLNGDADCYSFELKGKARYSKSAAEDQEYVTNFYRNNPEKRSLPVFDTIRMAQEQPPLRKPLEGGEAWTEPHGYWDGQWWTGAHRVERLGFVEGYLACHSRSSHLRGTFSKTPSQYVRLIDQWYRFDETKGVVDPNREDAKIADVLFKFRDHR